MAPDLVNAQNGGKREPPHAAMKDSQYENNSLAFLMRLDMISILLK